MLIIATVSFMPVCGGKSDACFQSDQQNAFSFSLAQTAKKRHAEKYKE
jgi:hypothetical protein